MVGHANCRWNYPSSVCNRNEVYVCSTFLIIIAWLRKNTVVSSRTTIIPVCDMHLLFLHSFLTNDLWWNLCQLWACRHYLCEYACGRFDSIGFVSKWKAKLMQIAGLTIAITALTGILLEETNTSTESHWQGITALISAVLIHAIIYTQCKKRSCTVSVITFNALPCLLAGLILSATGWFWKTTSINLLSTLNISYPVSRGFCRSFGILCYFALQQKANAFGLRLYFLSFRWLR